MEQQPYSSAERRQRSGDASRLTITPFRTEMRSYLTAPEVQEQLREQFSTIQQRLAIGITRAAELVGITPVQLRYLEALGALSPIRTSPGTSDDEPQRESEAKGHPGQRRYGQKDLLHLLIIRALLEQGFANDEIAKFLRNEGVLEELADSIMPLGTMTEQRQPSILSWVSRAEEALYCQMLVPRLLYLSMSLLFGQAIRSDVGLLLPLKTDSSTHEEMNITDPADLPALGETLLGWYSPTHPFSLFYMKHADRSLIQFMGRYQIRPLHVPSSGSAAPLNIHMVSESETNPEQDIDEAAQKAAGKLLKFLQDKGEEWRWYFQSSGTAMFNSPNFTDPYAGQRLMNELADTAVELGGLSEDTEGELKPRWRFASIFVPREPFVPLQQKNLVVGAKSKNSPHLIGGIPLESRRVTGISMLAFQSDSIVYRPLVARDRLDISLRELEETAGPIQSAIAIPIEGEHAPVGVLYVVSGEPEAFQKEAQLLLRLVARLIGEVVQLHHARNLLVDHFAEVIERPAQVDLFFSEFDNQSGFVTMLEELLQQVKVGKASDLTDLSIIAVNIDRVNQIANLYGDLAERSLVKAVGRRITEWISRQNALKNIRLYHMYADRYYIPLKNVDLEKAEVLARNLFKRLREHPYQIEATRHTREQHISPEATIKQSGVTAHLAVCSFDYSTLEHMLSGDPEPTNIRAKLIHIVEEALRLGRDWGGDNLMVWNRKTQQFQKIVPEPQGKQKAAQTFLDALEEDPTLLEKFSKLFEQIIDKVEREADTPQSNL